MDRNQLDPSVPSTTEAKKIPLIIKVYAVLCTLSGVGTLPSVAVFMWQVITALINGNVAAKLGDNTLVAVGLIVAGIMLSAASAIILIVFGLDLIKDQRRNAARLSYVLIAFTVVELLVDVMLQGIGPFLLRPAVQLDIPSVKALSQRYEECYEEFCVSKGWTLNIKRNAIYVLMHTFAHLLIKQMSMASGYSSSAAC